MASTQSTLNEYFKCKRSVRDGLFKAKLKSNNDLAEIEHASDKPVAEVCEFDVLNGISVPELQVVSLKNLAKPSTKAVRKTKAVTRSKPKNISRSSENIATAFHRAAQNKLSISPELQNEVQDQRKVQKKRVLDDEGCSDGGSEDSSEQVSSDREEATQQQQQQQQYATPDKSQPMEVNQRKRRHVAAADEAAMAVPGPATPDIKVTGDGGGRLLRGSVRKKLNLEAQDKQGNDVKENTKLTAMQLKKELGRCGKLAELQARLLLFNDGRNKLEKFRTTVLDEAQKQATQATTTVMSPRKAKGSPLKAASPLKLFSPSKLCSPYKTSPSASPRRRPPHPNLEHFQALDVIVPISPRKTPVKCSPPVGVGTAAAAAYLRHDHLLHDTADATSTADPAASAGLVLPLKYRLLREVFRAVDTIVSLLHNRHEVVTFSKLRPAVQEILRQSFQEKNLGQLARVFPLAYLFRQDKLRRGAVALNSAGSPNKTGYQMIITANFDYNRSKTDNGITCDDNPATSDNPPAKSSNMPSTPRVNLMERLNSSTERTSVTLPPPQSCGGGSGNLVVSSPGLASGKTSIGTFRKMDSLVLVERRALFHAALLRSLHGHHVAFLQSIEPGLAVPPMGLIRRWHPQFPLEEVPEVTPAPLPQPPAVEIVTTAQGVLTKARELFSVNPRLVAAVEHTVKQTQARELKEQEEKRTLEQRAKVVQVAQVTSVDLALKGISVSLLEKIRAREAASARRVMVRSSTETRRLEQLARLPEVARILRNVFVTERKAALLWEAVASKIAASHSGMLVAGELDDHLELLLKESEGWCTKHKLSGGVFLKINKNTDINTVVTRLTDAFKRYQRA